MFKQITLLMTLILSLNFSSAKANESITIIAPTSEVADGLDLYAVSELFKETANLEEFEAELNNPEYGINNLDLDGDGYIDFIRVVEEVVNDTHIIILQALVWEDEIQEVATIEIETSGNNYNMHVQGNEIIYGANYYIAPTHVHINTWPIIAWISRPIYRPYHSAYYWKSYPSWWKSHRPLLRKNYHVRTHKYKKHNSFVVTRNARVKHVTRVKYKPRTSVRVTKHVSHKKPNNNTRNTHTTVRQTTVRNNRNNTTVDRTANNSTRTTARTGVSTTTQTRTNKATVTKEATKTSRNKNQQKTTVKKDKKKAKAKDDKDDDKNKSKKQ